MRAAVLLGAGAAALAIWRAAHKAPSGVAPFARPASPGVLGVVRPRKVLADLDKLSALVELGRERGLEVLQGMLGGRTDHAA